MIKNERQYTITRSHTDEVCNTIGELQPKMRELQLDTLRGMLDDLEAELAEYDALHDATLIEATDYASVSFARLVEIAAALDLRIHYDVRLTHANGVSSTATAIRC